MAEAFTLAQKAGIDGENVSSLIGGKLRSPTKQCGLNFLLDFFPAPGMIAYADKILNEKFDGNAGFTIDGGIKDAT